MPNSLIFIDNRITNRTELLKQLPSDSRIIELNATQDGLQQIADAVSAYRNLDSIHLISHGSAGALYVGNSVLNSQTLPNYSAVLNTIGNSLSASGDVLLYGCNVAEGETGAAFIAQLAQATGADVAASTDITGQGGDWDLEAQQGTIESQALELKGVEALGERDFTILSQGGGIVITDLGGSDGGNSLSLQADGKILLGGTTYSNGSSNFALVRYNSDGSLDTSFSGDGKLTTDLGNWGDDSWDEGYSLSVQADGKILLGGYTYDRYGDGSYDFSLVRYNSNGRLDTSFSDDGKLTTDLGSSDDDYGQSLAIQADGKILLGGYSNKNFAVVRYKTNGDLDTSFSNDGMLTTNLGGSDYGRSLRLQADGKILLGGDSNGDFALVRYNTDGSLDTSFSGDGILTTDLGGDDSGNTLSLQADGKILLGGYTYSNGLRNFALVRYNTDGSLDTSFSGDGKLTTNLRGGDYGASLNLQADGKILLGGTSGGDFALVRYNTDGSLDTRFSGGIVTTDVNDYAFGNSLALQPDGKILLGGYSSGNFTLVRYNTNGAVDTNFGSPTGSLAIVGTATQGQVLSVTNAVIDPNGMNSDFLRYQWLADGRVISGATGNTLTLTQAQVDKTISLQLDYTDGLGENKSLLSTATETVANINDVGVAAVTGTAQQNQTLTASVSDTDGLGALTYQWLANGVAITGATASTFTLKQAQVGKVIKVNASYTDAFGMVESVTSSATRAVANINDAPTGSVTISGTATQNQTLTAISTLADVDGMGTISYQWLANGRAITSATGATLTLAQAQVGKAISVKASYTDGQNTLETVTSAATAVVQNINDVPTGGVTIAGIAKQGQTLTAANTLADVDGIGTITYQWLANGHVISGVTASTLTLAQAQVGKVISVKASYTDGQNTVETVTSSHTAAVQNVNDAPVGRIIIGGLIKYDALVGHQLTAISSLADADGLGTFTYQWLADGVAIRGATAETFIPTVSQQEKAISVKVQYTDGFGKKETVQSAVVATAQDAQYGDLIRVGSNDRLQGGIFTSDLYGYAGNDELSGDAGEDRLYGGYGDDSLYGGIGNDELEGDQGNDKLYGELGNDVLTGGTGRDSLYGGDGNDVLDGSSDRDFMDGSNGRDTYYVDNPGDVVRDSGTDNVKDVLYITAYLQSGYSLGEGIENAILSGEANASSLTGNASNNTLTGNTSENKLSGGVGIDTLNGGDGNDTLMGGEGKDVLNGGAGRDVFKLEKLIESGLDASTRDIVQSFERGQDKIGLSALDANTQVAGDQAFTAFITSAQTFPAAGQLQLKSGVLYGNTDADADAEFSIALTGITTLTMADVVA